MISQLRLLFVVPITLALFACTNPGGDGAATRLNADLPPMSAFSRTAVQQPNRSNSSIARDILLLTFQMENGRKLSQLSRFESPITIRVTGRNAPVVFERDLDQLLARLRDEAGLAISKVPSNQQAGLTIELVRRSDIQQAVPNAACFVIPGIDSWRAYRLGQDKAAQDWATLATRTKMAVFIPSDVSAQEMRDCLHEEVAQALGPVNDLYHLTDSVFNDDNFHTVLTGFDMLVLQAIYSSELKSGMNQGQVKTRLPAILARLNPGGRNGGPGAPADTSRGWIRAIEEAASAATSDKKRLQAAKSAVAIAQAVGWADHRLAFSHYILARIALNTDPQLALHSLAEANRIYRASPDTQVHAAHVAVQVASYELSVGRPERAEKITAEAIKTARFAQNAGLLANLLMLRAEALDELGRVKEAEALRLDSLGWARYAFTDERAIRKRLKEVAGLRKK